MIDLRTDGLFKWTIVSLWFCGAMYALLGVGFGGLFAAAGLMGPGSEQDAAMLVMMTMCMGVVGLACAAANFYAAWGLAKRKKPAWIIAVILGAMYAPSGCLPFGLLILYALMRNGVKQAYDADAESAGPREF